MSNETKSLRGVLDRAKTAHDGARYPGDLAAELLPVGAMELKPAGGGATTNRWFWALGTSSAVAASLVTAFVLTSRTPESQLGLPSVAPVGAGMGGTYAASPYAPIYPPVFQDLSKTPGFSGVGNGRWQMVPTPVNPGRAFTPEFAGASRVGTAELNGNYDAKNQPTFKSGDYTKP